MTNWMVRMWNILASVSKRSSNTKDHKVIFGSVKFNCIRSIRIQCAVLWSLSIIIDQLVSLMVLKLICHDFRLHSIYIPFLSFTNLLKVPPRTITECQCQLHESLLINCIPNDSHTITKRNSPTHHLESLSLSFCIPLTTTK